MKKFWNYEKVGDMVKIRFFNICYMRVGSYWQILLSNTNNPIN